MTDGTNLIRWNALTGEVVSRMPARAVPDFSSGLVGRLCSYPMESAREQGIRDGCYYRAGTGQIERNLSRGWDKVAWLPDGQRIVSGDLSGMDEPVVWDAQSGKVL